jgi:hypothetical protein
MSRLLKTPVHFTLLSALFLTFTTFVMAQQSAPPAPAPATAAVSPTPGGVTVQAIPDLDDTQSGTFLPDPDYINRFAHADPSLRKIDER